MSDSGIIGEAYGRKIHAREVVAIDEAGDGLCWVRLPWFGDDWLLIRSDARDVSRAVRKLRQIPAGEPRPRGAGRRLGLSTDVRAACLPAVDRPRTYRSAARFGLSGPLEGRQPLTGSHLGGRMARLKPRPPESLKTGFSVFAVG